MKRILTILALWLTIAATGAWAQNEAPDSVTNEVLLQDGSLVRAKRVPKRAPSEDYVYTYKGVKYTYITENRGRNRHNTQHIERYIDKTGQEEKERSRIIWLSE